MNDDIAQKASEALRYVLSPFENYSDDAWQKEWDDMTREEITRMAKQAGFVGFDGDNGSLRRFAALVADAEREAIAKYFAEHWRETWTDEQIAEALRARGQA
jgi:hypothetical protein